MADKLLRRGSTVLFCLFFTAQLMLQLHADADHELARYHKNLSKFLTDHVNISWSFAENISLVVTAQFFPIHINMQLDDQKYIDCSFSFHFKWSDPCVRPWKDSDHPGGQKYIDVFDAQKYDLYPPFRVLSRDGSIYKSPFRIRSDGQIEAISHGNIRFQCLASNFKGYPNDQYMCFASVLQLSPAVRNITCQSHDSQTDCSLLPTSALVSDYLAKSRYGHNWNVKEAKWRPSNWDKYPLMYLRITLDRSLHYEYVLERSCAIVMGILSSTQYLMAGRSSIRTFFNALGLLVQLFWFHDIQNFKTITFSYDTPSLVNLNFGVLMLQVIALVWSCFVYYATKLSDSEVPKFLENCLTAFISSICGPTVEQEHSERAQILSLNEQLFLAGYAGGGVNDDLAVPSLSAIVQAPVATDAAVIALEETQIAAEKKRLLRWNFFALNMDRILCLLSFVVFIILAMVFN